VETYIDQASGAQFQFISMNRLFEYTKLPQEKPARLKTDNMYTSFAVWIRRNDLGTLEMRGNQGAYYVVRQTPKGTETVLEQIPGTEQLRAPSGKTPALLLSNNTIKREPEEEEHKDKLRNSDQCHNLVAVQATRRDVKAMLTSMCIGDSEYVKFELQSSWLARGAELVVEDLIAGYGDIPRNILTDINLTVEARTKAAIVGTTGCGKSTFMLCLLRILEPRKGKIILNGVNTQDIGITTLRLAIGMVAQDPVLMSSTVRDNLDPMSFYNDEELWSALRMVRMEEPIKELEGGLRFNLTAEGSSLSYGQRQLLCMARTLVKQPPLLLLDEATSALDPYTQEIVQNAIESQFPQSTIVVIAHRLETIMNFDLIIVLNKGNLVEKGTVKDLASIQGGRFAGMLAAKRTW
jgi:ABC-type multidrug transport system fused ATPase/permease subunit